MWLMVVVALYLGWWIERREAMQQQVMVRGKLATLVSQLVTKNAQVEALEDILNNVRADERVAREQLAEFVATQDDKARIDVASGLFHRVAAPR
jgi:hypothetical protein